MTMKHTFDVAVIGNVGIDTNVYLNSADIDFNVEGNFTENIDYVGQAGGYTSRGYAQLGKQTAFIGYVGDDYNGQFIREEFLKDKIDATGMFTDPAGTSRSINIMYQDGRRRNFYDGKSHMTLHPDMDICSSILSHTKLVHFHIPNWARDLLPVARQSGATIACDIQDVVSIDDPYRHDFIQYADILFFSSANHEDPSLLIKAFAKINPKCIMIAGMGNKGCALGTEKGVEFFDIVDNTIPVIDTNGAGDGLAVGFLTSYVLDGYNLQDSIRRGQLTARHTCSLKATSSELITAEELNNQFNNC